MLPARSASTSPRAHGGKPAGSLASAVWPGCWAYRRPAHGKRSRKPQQTLTPDDSALGYLFHTPGCELPVELLDHAARLRKPVAVLDEGGLLEPAVVTRRSVPFAVFQTGVDVGPARAVARYLLQIGHSRIAYVSAFHGAPWSVNRYRGLCETYAEAGHADGVSLHAAGSQAYPGDYASGMVERHGLAAFLDSCDAAEKRFPLHHDRALETLRDSVVSRFVPEEIADRLAPVFERALADTTVTAWVCCNDPVALAALHYLKTVRQVVVPGRLSVVGFDNTLDAFSSDLTSYDFNIPAVVRAMIDFVIRPPRGPARPGGHVQRIDGVLVERSSTARCARWCEPDAALRSLLTQW